MRRGQVGVLLAVTSGLFSVLLAVAVNVATGGSLPGALASISWLAWPVVGVLGLVGIGLAIWQQHLAAAPDPVVRSEAASPAVPPRPAGVPADVVGVAGPPVRVPAELPAAVALFGRDAVAREVGAMLGGAAVVVVAAAPGVGKTALAVRVAHDVRGRFPDGQLYAALLGGSGEPVAAEAVLVRFLGALGVPGADGLGRVDELAARFRSAVADRAVLVVLDDARDAAQVAPLLPGGARCATLVTSRRPLAELAGGRVVGLGAIDDEAGLALLGDVAGDGRVAADLEGAKALVAACGGLPLAVRIAGGRLRARGGWTPGQLAARLGDERGRLDELRQGELAVRATFRGAYDGLRQADQVVFRRAGSHPGQTFGPAAAAARAGLPQDETAAALERLADGFLVESPAPDRYRLHDLLRLFATEMVDAAGERREVVERLLRHLAAPAVELDGVPAVLREGLALGLAPQVREPADAVAHRLADPFERLAAWQAAAEALREVGGARLARALRWVSHSYTFVGQVQRALPPAQEGVALAEAAGDRREIAQCTRRLGEVFRDLERFDEAEAALRRALELFAEMGPVEEEVEVSAALGVLYNNHGRFERSLPVLERALTLLPDEVRDGRRGWVLLALTLPYRRGGDASKAAELAAEATALARDIGDSYLLGYCHQDAGWALVDLGDFDGAEAEFAAMLGIFRELRVGSGEASALANLGVVAHRRGDIAAAHQAFAAAEELFRRLGDENRAELWRGHRLG